MNQIAKKFLSLTAKWLLALYILLVIVLVILKLTGPGNGLPWPEVFYGPAIQGGSIFLIFALACWWCSRNDRAW